MAVLKMGTFDKAPEKQGLTDSGHVILECSSCGSALADIWLVKPDAINPITGQPFKWRLKAMCCYCGDHSFETEVIGRFALGAVGIDTPNVDPDCSDESKILTHQVRQEIIGDLVILHTKKAE